MSVRRRKDSWLIDIVVWRGGERIRHRKTVKGVTKAEAVALEREERRKLDQNLKIIVKVPLFDEFAWEFVETYAVVNNKPSEVRAKQSAIRMHLGPFFGQLRLDAIGSQEIEKFKATQLAAKLSPKSINNRLIILHRILVVAKEWGRLASVPTMRWLRTPMPDIDFMTFDEARRLLAGAEPAWYPMILLALRTGLRQGELLALRWEDIDLDAGRLRVCRSVYMGIVGTTKSGKIREIPLSDKAMMMLRSLPSRLASGLAFPGPGGRLLTGAECRSPLLRACKRAGLRKIGWHTMRHTFASHLVMRGAPLKAVQELLGHANIQMTMRYAHLTADVRRDAVRLLDGNDGDTYGARATSD